MLRKFTSAIQEFGWRDGLGYLIDQLLYDRLGWGGYSRYLLTAQPIPEVPQKLRPSKLRFCFLEEGNPLLKTLPLDDDILRRRFDQKAVCLAAIEGEGEASRAIACAWFTFGEYIEDMVRCRYVLNPASETAWDFDVYVDPEYRLGRTFARLWDEANAFLRAHGVRWSLSRISAYNLGSLRSHRRLGAEVVGRANFLYLGRFQVMWASVPPYFHVSFGKSGPALQTTAPRKP